MGRATRPATGPKAGASGGTGTMVEKFKDPVCGMMVEPNRAVASGRYGGKSIYFCSAGCKATYDRAHPPSG
ncbi:MAG: YHS domain-containing protein [Thermoplasmata archaeon]